MDFIFIFTLGVFIVSMVFDLVDYIMKTKNLLSTMFILTIAIVMSLWMIDVSVGNLMAYGNAYITNGWFKLEPMKLYHLCIYVIILSMFFYNILLINLLTKNKPVVEYKKWRERT